MADSFTNSKSIGDIYRMIYYNRQASRQEIAKTLGISLPTATQNINNLRMLDFIYNAGEFESTGGRKPVMLQCVPDARLAIGLDITRNHLSMVVIDLNLNIIFSKRIRISFEESDAYFSKIHKEIESVIQACIPDPSKLLGVGVSMPAIIQDDQKTLSYATVIDASSHIYDLMAHYIPVPFLLFNDANSAGLAESWQSDTANPMVYLSLSNSVGGAYMNHHSIDTGVNWRGSEFGHMTIFPNGKTCYCGKSGCLDAYCSAGVLSAFTEGDLKLFFQELKKGENAGLVRIFDEYMDVLAIAVNNLRMCYDCDIVLGGNVGIYMADYIDDFRQKALARNPFEQDGSFIRVCHYLTEASAVGAAIYYVNKFISEF